MVPPATAAVAIAVASETNGCGARGAWPLSTPAPRAPGPPGVSWEEAALCPSVAGREAAHHLLPRPAWGPGLGPQSRSHQQLLVTKGLPARPGRGRRRTCPCFYRWARCSEGAACQACRASLELDPDSLPLLGHHCHPARPCTGSSFPRPSISLRSPLQEGLAAGPGHSPLALPVLATPQPSPEHPY